ncbi:MAG: hypothetical protein QXZ31_09925 [Thermofilaceae archaeon]
MSLKVLVGILLLVAGLGMGVLEWFTAGLAGPYPLAGLAATAIGAYLIVDGLRGRRSGVKGEDLLAAAGVTAGVIAGTLLIEELRKRQAKMSDMEILELEKALEEARLTGRIPLQKYLEYKAELERIKQKRGLKVGP